MTKRLIRLINRENKKGMSYREMSKICGVKAGTINRLAKEKGAWIPKRKDILLKLGLIHPKVKRLADMSKDELLWCLNNRQIM